MNAVETLCSNAEVVIGREVLEERLRGSRPLRIKFGVDPTRPDLTFGHLVVFNKLRQFQDMGHEAILLIGDYTGMIGDPSGRSSVRPALTEEEVQKNASTYLDQAFKVLDKSRTTVRRNSEWFKQMGFGDILILARKMTVAQMLERDDFAKRFSTQVPISIVEFLYPLMQGYDSVVLKADVEIGGQDQLFNMLVGRTLQKDAGQAEQVVLGMPLLVGLDGVRKMSKSYDNYIAFNDTPQNMFGKVMSIPDNLMWAYHRLLLLTPMETIAKLQKGHPMEVKKQLASALVQRFYSAEQAQHERAQFEKVFSDKQNPDAMPEFAWADLTRDGQSVVDVLAATGLFPSKKEIRRLIEQGAVRTEGNKVSDPTAPFAAPSTPVVVQAGKRTFFRIQAR